MAYENENAMDNVVDEVVEECNSTDVTTETETSEKASGLAIAGGIALVVAAGYGIYEGGKKLGGWIKNKKKANELKSKKDTPELEDKLAADVKDIMTDEKLEAVVDETKTEE